MQPKTRAWQTAVLWALVVLWAIFIFMMSVNTGSDLSGGGSFVSLVYNALQDWQHQVFGPEVDIVTSAAHFCEYTVFGALLCYALGWRDPRWLFFVIAIVIGSLYGASDEVHQIFVPDRTADVMDWLVDTCGTALGAVIAMGFLRLWDRDGKAAA